MRRLFGKIVNETMVLNNEGSVVDEEWKSTEIVRTNVKLDMFQVMPNHMHMVFEIVDMPFRRGVPRTPTLIETGASIAPLHRQPQSVGSIIGGFKSSVTKRIRILNNDPTLKIWQRGYYDRIIRNGAELDRVRTYILNNPQTWEDDEYYH